MSSLAEIELDLAYAGPDPWGRNAGQRCWAVGWHSFRPNCPPLAGRLYSLGLQFCDDAAIAELNGQWRQQPKPTDVLSFAAQEDAPEPSRACPSSWATS